MAIKILLSLLAAAALVPAQTQAPWALSNFPARLEVTVSNPSTETVDGVAVIPVREATGTALNFPGSLAIVIAPGARNTPVPCQADDLDGDGEPDEFVFPVKLAAGESRDFHIYYSTTLTDSLPYPKRVHASHRYGYNQSTVALESEVIGYRSYGGFFLDIQARREGQPGLYNSLVGWLGSRTPSTAGLDIIHLGDTLGLGGVFLRSGNDVYRPPLNMPDYAHKPQPAEVPAYRVIATGPVRAVVEQRMDSWTIGADRVRIVARYSIIGGSSLVECRVRVMPISVSRKYEVGTGIRHLPKMQQSNAPGRLLLSGEQNAATGPLGLALYYAQSDATPSAPLATREDKNECVVFSQALEPGKAVDVRYAVAGAWSGSGVKDLLGWLAGVGKAAGVEFKTGNFRLSKTPMPNRVEGEAY